MPELNSKSQLALRSAVAAVALGVGAMGASAATITTPAGLSPGDKFHVVFVTDGIRSATSFDIADYDAFVSADAGATTYNGSPVTWQALASTEGGVSALSRFNPVGATIHRLDGVKVADDGVDLWDSSGTIFAPVDVSPTATGVVADVWTGTNSDGSEAKGLGGELVVIPQIGEFTETTIGRSDQTGSNWISNGGDSPTQQYRLYAFSNELTVVPEPASATVLAASALALLRRRSR